MWLHVLFVVGILAILAITISWIQEVAKKDAKIEMLEKQNII